MATASDARAVKSLNTGPGRQRFTFKTFSQRIEEVEIDVYRSLDPIEEEPSEGSSFFRDCLVQWRELNTAEDFISFYEEMLPFVQTLPQIILQKELIFSKLLSNLQIKGRLSLEPILRLIAALSRDLAEDFLPFLQKFVDALVFLLRNGADREPDIIEQIFTSWSCTMMYLQRYLVKDIRKVLKVTVKLRYYPKNYVQEFMADSMSFLLRNAPLKQLIKGIKKVMSEVAQKPLAIRKTGASALLWYTMRGVSSRLHSRATQMLRLLMDESILSIGEQLKGGPETVLDVLTEAFGRLCEELEPTELKLLWCCLYEEITAAIADGQSLHLNRLLSVLISTMQRQYMHKFSEFQLVLELVRSLVEKFVVPSCNVEASSESSEVTDNILQLMLYVLDGLKANDVAAISSLPLQWASVFHLRNKSLLSFIKDILLKDICIINYFRVDILSALADLLGTFEDVVYLLFVFCERLRLQGTSILDNGMLKEKLAKIQGYFENEICCWIEELNNTVHQGSSSIQIQNNRLAILWGIIRCYPYFSDAGSKGLLLMNLVNALNELLKVGSGEAAGVPNEIWQSLIGVALSSYHKLLHIQNAIEKESLVSIFLNFAKRYKSSVQILSAVAEVLDSVYGSVSQADYEGKRYHCELEARNVADVLDTFGVNLSHSDKGIRVSTLKILCHLEPLGHDYSTMEQSTENKGSCDISENCHVLHLLLSIEEMPPSVDNSRKITLLISRIQMNVTAGRIVVQYMPAVLSGIIGIFHNRFSIIWDPALDCLAVFLRQYSGIIWDRYVHYLDYYQSFFMNLAVKGSAEFLDNSTDLGAHFNSFVNPLSDSTPKATVLSLLVRCLQKVPHLAESRSQQVVPSLLKFLGYNVDDLVSVESFNSKYCKGKEWKGVLKEWLSLFILMRKPKSLHLSQFVKEVLECRLLDESDAELQTKVLDCLLNWKDDFLVPYYDHLINLVKAKSLREELTTWSLSRESDLVDMRHRNYLIPIVIRTLVPKVRKLKNLASRKKVGIHYRKAILGFLAQLDVEELSLFFALLVKPLKSTSEGAGNKLIGSPPEVLKNYVSSVDTLNFFTTDCTKALSIKKKYGFLHVVEDIIEVFDEWHVSPFLDLLMGCVIRILESCTSAIEMTKRSELSMEEGHINMVAVDDYCDEAAKPAMSSTAVKQHRELRSLCLRIISLVLSKYEDHDLSYEFWDLFFASVKPLVAGIKVEGASSEKPSSLFCCFLAMSRNSKLVPLLSKEENLVPDIFKMLTVSTASYAIISSVFKFIKNLLCLDGEMDDENSNIRLMLLSHLDVLVCSLHHFYMDDGGGTRKLVRCPTEKELDVFKLLSKYIEEPVAARKFVDVLLPLLAKKPHNSDSCVVALQIIRDMVKYLGSGSSKMILNSIALILISAGLDVRMSICDVLDALAGNDSSILVVAKFLRELNAIASVETDDDTSVIGAYGMINASFFYSVPEEHALIILSQSVHDLSSNEMIVRQNAYELLLSFVKFSSEIIGQEVKSAQACSGGWVKQIINNFLLKHMGDAMNREGSVQKVWMNLLREMILNLPQMANFSSYSVLCSEDVEQDFFYNITHLQKHRRARALSRFKTTVISNNLSEGITNKVFVPLLFNMLFEIQDGKGENVRRACIDALAAVSGCMHWKSYYALLKRCFHDITRKPDKKKVLLRLICSILDYFHFPEALSTNPNIDSSGGDVRGDTVESNSSQSPLTCSASAKLSDIQTCLLKFILPKVQKFLSSDHEDINVNINLIALKLLKLLPGEIMDLQLPNIIHRISNFLKNRRESVRDEARSALAACLHELGPEYLQFIIKVLRGTLKRGYELHVLGYTINFILSKFLQNRTSGKLDYCVEDLLSIAENDILGDVSEEKEVEKIASKMKETRKQKSFETLKLVAESITFKTHALRLLSPVTIHLGKQLTPKVKAKLENMLNHICLGIECNPSADQKELLIFTYGLIEDGISNEHLAHGISLVQNGKKDSGDLSIQGKGSEKLIHVDPRYYHLITVFALGILQNCMKRMKLNKKDEQQLSMLDPFIRLLSQCLISKFENIISMALKCLSPLVRLPLPSLDAQAGKIKNSLLAISQNSVNVGSPLTESCISLLTVLLRSTSITLSADQLRMLIQFPFFIDVEKNPSFVALSLLKAVVNRKLVVPEVYTVVEQVAKLMVTSQVEAIRKKCSKILLQFLLDYPISDERLQQHIQFFLDNLRYKHSTGREAVLEMLHAIIVKFPTSVLDEKCWVVFMCLVVALTNDHDNKVRSMIGAVIKLLVGRVSPHSLDRILEYCLSWYRVGNQNVRSAAAQVLGLLVEVMKNGFQKHVSNVLTMMKRILLSDSNILSVGQENSSKDSDMPSWKETYYSLVFFEKLLHQFPLLCLNGLEDIWGAISALLLHRHLWLRIISNRLVASYFAMVTEACKDNQAVSLGDFFLMRPGRLFLVAASLCCQLKQLPDDDAASTLVTQNLVFTICGLDSFFRSNEGVDFTLFWSGLHQEEQECFQKAFDALDSRKGRGVLASFTSSMSCSKTEDKKGKDNGSLIVSYLLKRLGKVALQMEIIQMKITFNCFKSIAPEILSQHKGIPIDGENDTENHAYQILLPLYKVCEGYAGKVISDDTKQLATEACDCIRNTIGVQNFVQIYSQIRKNLKAKRDKRKHDEKLMAVVNPMRNAKRKLRLAAKHRANKKRKVATMKMGRWMR